MDEGQMEERRATVQVHVVAVDRPKSSTKHAIIYWQIETTAEATASMGGAMVSWETSDKKNSK